MRNRVLLILGLLVLFVVVKAQSPSFQVKGMLWDELKNEAVIYATIAARSAANDEVLHGTVSGDDGIFLISVPDENFYLEVSFLGYETKIIREFDKTRSYVDLGRVGMKQQTQQLSEFVVRGEKSTVEYRLDKKVFNVGQDLTSAGLSALEVLNNVPSVNVDLEGNISLRGNTGVQVLINGKPSVLADAGSNALGTITAEMMESVEVITNPSAKYEAEGTSGIINIILKKEEKEGVNGSISLNTGIPHNHSVGLSLNKRTEKFNFFTQLGGGYGTFPAFNENFSHDLVKNSILESSGENFRNEYFYNITLGADYHINNLNIITLSGSYSYEFENETSETAFSRFGAPTEPVHQWNRYETTDAGNPDWQFDLEYKKQFSNNKEHFLLAGVQGNFFGKESNSAFRNVSSGLFVPENDQLTETDFHQANYTLRADYTNPVSKKVNIETGLAYTINDVANEYLVSNLDDGIWLPDPLLNNNFGYNQKVFGAYATVAFEQDKWGIKTGLRFEQTDLMTMLENTNQENQQNYADFFPSIHTSYKITQFFSIQAGYSKRIYRPRLWDLNPFFNIRNNYNIRTGNPDLMPQYADSYEITGVFIFEKLSLNSSLYHLFTRDVIEWVSEFKDEVVISSPFNIGTNAKTGINIDGKYEPAKWINLNGDINYGLYVREGEYKGESFDRKGDQWSARLISKLKLPADVEIEMTGRYESSYKTIQGEVKGFAHADIGIRKKLWNGKLIIDASIRDIFESRFRKSYVYQPDYTAYSFSQRGRFFRLGVSYGFGKGEAMYYRP